MSNQDEELQKRFEKISLEVANDRLSWVNAFKLVRQETLEELAQGCDQFCDCTCCGRVLRGIHPEVSNEEEKNS